MYNTVRRLCSRNCPAPVVFDYQSKAKLKRGSWSKPPCAYFPGVSLLYAGRAKLRLLYLSSARACSGVSRCSEESAGIIDMEIKVLSESRVRN